MLDNLPPIWERKPSDWLMSLVLRLKGLEQEQSENPAAAIEVWHQTILLSKAELQALQPQHSKDSLFDQDYVAWVKEQIRLLHLQQFEKLDLEHLPDEVNDLVFHIQRLIETNLEIICNHLLKYKYARESLNDEPCCNSWRSTLFDARHQIADEVADSPSLQDYPAQELDNCYKAAIYQVYRQTHLPDDSLPETCPWTIKQILDEDWLPD